MDHQEVEVRLPDSAREGRLGEEAALAVEGVGHAYGRRRALDNVAFTVAAGTFTALLGPNGAGKTTLFGLVTRLLALREGTIRICDVPVSAGARALAPLGVVFQQTTLDLDLTVRQNLRYFAALRGMARRDADRRIDDELGRLEMAERAKEKVRDLNGGHRRRVELARALLHEPAILVLDEPTVGLDVGSRRLITDHVHDLAARRGIGVLWATHLIDEIRPGDALVVLAQGRVVETGRACDVVRRAGADTLDAAFAALTRRPGSDGAVSAPPAEGART